jgi:hypothetical protein
MRIGIRLSVAGELVKEAFVTVDDMKFEDLTEDEKESAVEILVREWANRNLHLEWEVETDSEPQRA